jgi:hypothetical protein
MRLDYLLSELRDMESVYIVRDHDHEAWLRDRKKLEAALLHEVTWREMADDVTLTPGELDSKETRLCTNGLVSYLSLKTKVGNGLLVHSLRPECRSISCNYSRLSHTAEHVGVGR